MSEAPNLPFQLGPEDVATQMMLHTHGALIWGWMITNQALPPERVLMGATLPDYISLYTAQIMAASGNYLSKPEKRTELHLPVENIVAYHLMPPQQAAVAFDETEMHRKMEPFTVLLGPFRINAEVRIAEQSDLKSYLTVAKSDFMEAYNAQIAHAYNPNMKPLASNYVVIRRTAALYASRS